MPELPEVETNVRLVRPLLCGRRILGGRVAWERTLGGLSRRAFLARVRGARIVGVWRRAKYIVLDLERGGRSGGHLLIHLRMTGRLFVDGPADGLEAYERLRLDLEGGVLRFVDVRKFGRVTWNEDLDASFQALGVEPLGSGFTADWFREGLRRRRRQLKPLLLDQAFVAGLGNIYVDESLHRAGLHPLRRSDRVPARAAEKLCEAIRETLDEAIRREGSSFDAFYRTPEGRPGSYQHQFLVYGRQGRPCRTCGRTIRKILVAQRGTHLCTRCQPAPRGATS